MRVDVTNANGVTVTVFDDVNEEAPEHRSRTYPGPAFVDWIGYTMESSEFQESVRVIGLTAPMSMSMHERFAKALYAVAMKDFGGDQ